MSWTNIRLIWFREVRDQLRDRRTIFTLAVLPLLLYPLLGMTLLQVTQFMKEHETPVLVLGADALPAEPALISGDRFAAEFCPAQETRLLQLTIRDQAADLRSGQTLAEYARQQMQTEPYVAVLAFPDDFARHLAATGTPDAGGTTDDAAEPTAIVFINAANDKSRIAAERIERVVSRWRSELVSLNLEARGVPRTAVDPFELVRDDVSAEASRRAAFWSKALPLVVVIWALTGAFYPAIDLCAGEKERGTLETLLCSPALRTEIVGGKLLTVMTFSVATALLNLASMGLTGMLIIRQIQSLPNSGFALSIGPPPLLGVCWLLLATLPVAALFSAVALAVAAFARSAKEGQYYLMPLLLISLPLMILPLLPAAQLEPGSSVIPVTGMMLWLRVLIEGRYGEALQYTLPVLGATAICCWLAIRWAVRQFETEAVLFRESERFGLGLWMRHKMRDRGATPSAPEAILAGVVLLLITFFASLQAVQPSNWSQVVRILVVTQFGLILVPSLLMTVMLTRSPRQTLLLIRPKPLTVPAAVLLAFVMHPLVVLMSQGIERMYPLSEETLQYVEQLSAAIHSAPPWQLVLVIALLPAVCEEIAFRGFILSGLRHVGSKWTAIVVSSVFFGLTHGMLQQSLAAGAVGLILGYIAVQSGSLLPGIVFHLTHNSLGVMLGRVSSETVQAVPWLRWLLGPSQSVATPNTYHYPILIASGVLTIALLLWFRRLPYGRSQEEILQEATHHRHG
jgi:sodium transport system permease protein